MIYKFGKHTIELFDSIETLPILRFQRFNKYQMQSIEIGNTFEDYDQRTMKTLQFLQKGMTQEAIMELENRRETVFKAYNDFTPHGKSFAVMVKRIDDKHYSTFTDENINKCLDHLERIGFTQKESINQLKEVKKKIEIQLSVYFPALFPKNGNLEVVALRIKKVNASLDDIIEQSESTKKNVFNIEKELLEQAKPNVWNMWKTDNMERVLEVDFYKYFIATTGNVTNPKEMMTFAFYANVVRLMDKKPKNGKQ